MTIKFTPDLILPEQKVREGVLPFLSFPITTDCPFRCLYCGEGGETTASLLPQASVDFVVNRCIVGHELGIRKFRLTGGEPTFHPDFKEICDNILKLDDVLLLINTNGVGIFRHAEWLSSIKNKNIKFAISLDTLNPKKFDQLSGTKGNYKIVMDGIIRLLENGNLHRLNMVVNQWNHNEVKDIIGFCQKLKCNLKLLEICSVPLPFSNWDDIYINLVGAENEIAEMATSVNPHQYSRGYGIPMPTYKVDSIQVTIKSSKYGAHYDTRGVCKNCKYFPCHEGLYDLYQLPDGRLCGCRWSEQSVAPGETFYEQLVYLTKSFQRAEWIQRSELKEMPANPKFVQHFKKKNICTAS